MDKTAANALDTIAVDKAAAKSCGTAAVDTCVEETEAEKELKGYHTGDRLL